MRNFILGANPQVSERPDIDDLAIEELAYTLVDLFESRVPSVADKATEAIDLLLELYYAALKAPV